MVDGSENAIVNWLFEPQNSNVCEKLSNTKLLIIISIVLCKGSKPFGF